MNYHEIFYRSADGLLLYARDYGPGTHGLMPVLCLPGLTRNAKDFHALASRLAPQRRVVAADFRGRGRSQYSPEPATYRPQQELADTLVLMNHLDLPRVAVAGTSRGGLVGLLMAGSARERLAGIAFNDIGPRLEPGGLLRIRSYLGTDPQFASWDEAAAALKATNPGLQTLNENEWRNFATLVFRDEGGVPRADYDPFLATTFPTENDIVSGKVPDLWTLFDSVPPLPALVLRGEHSDLLSAATVAEMRRRHPGLAAVTVANRGHVPFLDEPECIAAIGRWLAEVDLAARGN